MHIRLPLLLNDLRVSNSDAGSSEMRIRFTCCRSGQSSGTIDEATEKYVCFSRVTSDGCVPKGRSFVHLLSSPP